MTRRWIVSRSKLGTVLRVGRFCEARGAFATWSFGRPISTARLCAAWVSACSLAIRDATACWRLARAWVICAAGWIAPFTRSSVIETSSR